jgi:hypothetical protein
MGRLDFRPSDERSDTDSVLGRRGGISHSHMHIVYPSVSLLFLSLFLLSFPWFRVCIYIRRPCVESSGREPQSHLIRVSFLSLAEFRIRWRLLLD